MLFAIPTDLDKLEKLESIRSECVARIIVPPEKMPAFMNALKTNYERYLAKKQETNEGVSE